MQWYYISGGNQHGPIDELKFFEMVKDGRVSPSDPVWNESMADWANADKVIELFDHTSQPIDTDIAERPEVNTAARQLTGEMGNELPTPPTALDKSFSDYSNGPVESISCVAPLGPAWNGMKEILFNPFDLGKWFVLGFSAWLASLGQGGGSFNMNSGSGSNRPMGTADEFRQFAHKVMSIMQEYGMIIISVGACVALIVYAISLAIMWVNSRGKFMFLDNVVHNRSNITEPWERFRKLGNSLFVWRFILGLICLPIVLAILSIAIFGAVIPAIKAGSFDLSFMPAIVISSVLLLVFAVGIGLVTRFLEDFVIPIMYKFDLRAVQAWRRFLVLLKEHFWKFILYSLFYVVLGMAAVVCVMLAMIVTCCTAFCLLMIPYVGTVATLPILVFFRIYSIKYLAQFGLPYDLAHMDALPAST